MSKSLCALAALVAVASSASAQNFNSPDFTNTTGLSFVGTAAASSGSLIVAPATASARGAAYRSTRVNVAAGFETTFNFRIASPALGADGMTFIVHADPLGTAALGGDGSTMGYGGQGVFTPINNALVIELDCYDAGTPWFDPNDNHISIQTNGSGAANAFHAQSLGFATPPFNINDNGSHSMKISYTPGTLSVFVDGATTPLISVPYNFATGGTYAAGGAAAGLNLINGTDAFVGFTASCGGLTQTHTVTSWSFTQGGSTPVVYCTSGTSTAGCAPTISASGQPSASAASACTISIAGAEGQRQGLVFYGLDNTGFTPLQWSATSTSFLCIKSPTQRTLPQVSGGTAGQCNGSYTLDWNNFLATFAALGEPFAAGDKLYAQGWYRDPPASKTTNLTNAVELTFVP
jgi:hypothetical protein